ncbi:MAG TPA: cysteine desulfurase family protein [Acidobacteriota bacterium]|nr:cysteine desulfurase family protein [Acidobacteriota bacterium]
MKERIYLDNSATTRVDELVLEAMLPCFRENFGNASSVHIFGQEARAAVEDARRSVAELLGADGREIVFTSGGTESDNAALWGVFRSGYRPGNHIITTKIEHPAVLATCKAMESSGAEVTYIPVAASGRVDTAAIEAAIRESTILISVMHANNETGVIQPIEELSAIAGKRGILLHTDAVQSVGKIPTDVNTLGVDLLSLSAHKIHGPKGVGALYIRKGTKTVPFMTGGSHERKRRAGTENVPAIAGLGMAARLAMERQSEMQTRVRALRDSFESRIIDRIQGARVNGQAPRLPNVSNLSFENLEGEAAVIALDLEGVAVSTGSACSSGALDPSHVLTAMGLRPEVVQGSLRFSLCYHNTDEELEKAFQILESVVQRLRKLSRRTYA